MQWNPEEKRSQIIELFQTLFAGTADTSNQLQYEDYPVKLLGGFPEPFYLAPKGNGPAEIRFTRDYLNSCFHEVAHWCIAGKERRRQDDYGYWYRPDGRDEQAQQAFFQAEAGPQALEWVFATASDEVFRISCDNLEGETDSDTKYIQDLKFTEALQEKLNRYLADGFPPRGKKFLEGLMGLFHPEVEKLEITAWIRARALLNSSSQGPSSSIHP